MPDHQLAEELLRRQGPRRAWPTATAPTSLGRQADGRQRRRHHGGHGHVVEPDDADVARARRRPRCASPAMTPSAIWSLKASTAVTPLATMSGTTARHGVEGRAAHRRLDHFHAACRAWTAAPRSGAPPRPTIRSAHPDRPGWSARVRPDGAERSATAGAVRKSTEDRPRHRTVDEDSGLGSQGVERRWSRRGETTMNPSTSRARDSAARTSSSGCSPVSTRSTCSPLSRADRSTERTSERSADW